MLDTVVSEIIGKFTIKGPGSLETVRAGWNDYKTFYNPQWINRSYNTKKMQKGNSSKIKRITDKQFYIPREDFARQKKYKCPNFQKKRAHFVEKYVKPGKF